MNKIEHTHKHTDYTFEDIEKESEYGEHILRYDAFLYYPLSVELKDGDTKTESKIYLSFEQIEAFVTWFERYYAKLKHEHENAVRMMDGEDNDNECD